LDREGHYNLNRLSNIVARGKYSLTGLLGILNSTLFNWLYATRFFDYEIKPVYLRNSPLADANSRSLVSAVERMLALHRQLAEARTPHDKTFLQAQIDATDREIDRLVYDLYDLTEEEIAIVEGRSQ
jgi:hypothetical protein